MPKASVTQATIKRTVKAVQAVGLPVMRVEVAPDGTVAVYPGVSGGKSRHATQLMRHWMRC